jgi:hypothetical protein
MDKNDFYKFAENTLDKNEVSRLFYFLVGYYGESEEFQTVILDEFKKIRRLGYHNQKEHDEFLDEEIKFDLWLDAVEEESEKQKED